MPREPLSRDRVRDRPVDDGERRVPRGAQNSEKPTVHGAARFGVEILNAILTFVASEVSYVGTCYLMFVRARGPGSGEAYEGAVLGTALAWLQSVVYLPVLL